VGQNLTVAEKLLMSFHICIRNVNDDQDDNDDDVNDVDDDVDARWSMELGRSGSCR